VCALTGGSKALAGPLGCGSDRTQNIQFGTTQASRLSDQVAAHSGGSRATAATSDRYAARLAIQSTADPIEYELLVA
jgi:hypothetical protein